ncbi:hypothetical protein GQ44DRAFT_787635 [Phaeosphaeriaceae sp. PMI808]|nr:hypothetical protein GQ44DRAFT_787635 [Phaeosphaeriaceae sp. PMI808]
MSLGHRFTEEGKTGSTSPPWQSLCYCSAQALSNAFINPVTTIDPSTKQCNFGIRTSASVPVLAINIISDAILTSFPLPATASREIS